MAHARWDWAQQEQAESKEDELVELQKKSDRNLLLLLQAACKTDKAMRALELFSLLSLPRSFDAAISIASKFNLSALVDRMTLLHQAKMRERERLEDALSASLFTDELPKRRNLSSADADTHNQLRGAAPVVIGKPRHPVESPAPPLHSLNRDSPSLSSTLSACVPCFPPISGS